MFPSYQPAGVFFPHFPHGEVRPFKVLVKHDGKFFELDESENMLLAHLPHGGAEADMQGLCSIGTTFTQHNVHRLGQKAPSLSEVLGQLKASLQQNPGLGRCVQAVEVCDVQRVRTSSSRACSYNVHLRLYSRS